MPRLAKLEIRIPTKDKEGFIVTKLGFRWLYANGSILYEDMSLSTVDLAQIEHDLLITDLRLIFELMLPRSRWTSERFLRFEQGDQVPDGLLCYFDGHDRKYKTVAIEVELNQKSKIRYKKKIQDYIKDDSIDMVIYFVTKESVANIIHGYSYLHTDKIYVCYLDEFLKDFDGAYLYAFKEEYLLGDVLDWRRL